MKLLQRIFAATVFFCLILPPSAALCVCEYDYREEAEYWKKIYDREEAAYLEKVHKRPLTESNKNAVVRPPIIHMGRLSFWMPQVVHIAVLEDALEGEDQEVYKDVRFPLYCGYIVFGHDENSVTFVKKTELPVEKVVKVLQDIAGGQIPPEEGYHDLHYRRVRERNHIATVVTFYGLYGMGFVPEFKYSYPYGQRPEAVSYHSLFELTNPPQWTNALEPWPNVLQFEYRF